MAKKMLSPEEKAAAKNVVAEHVMAMHDGPKLHAEGAVTHARVEEDAPGAYGWVFGLNGEDEVKSCKTFSSYKEAADNCMKFIGDRWNFQVELVEASNG